MLLPYDKQVINIQQKDEWIFSIYNEVQVGISFTLLKSYQQQVRVNPRIPSLRSLLQPIQGFLHPAHMRLSPMNLKDLVAPHKPPPV